MPTCSAHACSAFRLLWRRGLTRISLPKCQSYMIIVLKNKSSNMRQRFLKAVFNPTQEHLPGHWPSKIAHIQWPWPVSILTDITDLSYCDILWFTAAEEGQKGKQEVSGSWGRRSHGVALPGDGTMMQNHEQPQHLPCLGCYRGLNVVIGHC